LNEKSRLAYVLRIVGIEAFHESDKVDCVSLCIAAKAMEGLLLKIRRKARRSSLAFVSRQGAEAVVLVAIEFE